MVRILFVVGFIAFNSAWANPTADQCRVDYGKLIRVETPSKLRQPIQQAVARAETLLAEGQITPEQFRETVNDEFTRLTGAEDRETVLFVDTPVMSADGKVLNREDVTFVIDHHQAYSPENGMDNSGAQVIARLSKAAEANVKEGKVDVDAAFNQFQRDLYGNDADHVALSADNLADAAEVIAILRSPELQKRIIANPELAKLLTQSGHFTDFFVFGGDGYEKGNTSPEAQRAIAISKAIMHSHSELLRKYGVPGGDRIEGLPQDQQAALLEEAVVAAEKILLEATDPTRNPNEPGSVQALSGEFNNWRGDPQTLTRADGNPTSFAQARQKHEEFTSELPGVLAEELAARPGNTDTPEVIAQKAKTLAAAVNRGMFGHGSVSTGHQFADWAASPMANAYNPSGRRPVKFELGGSGDDVGKPVVIAKSGPPEEKVDVRPYLEALNKANEAAKEKMRERMIAEGKKPEEIEQAVGRVSSFIPRGETLMFNFGGHALSRQEVQLIVAETALRLEQDATTGP